MLIATTLRMTSQRRHCAFCVPFVTILPKLYTPSVYQPIHEFMEGKTYQIK